MRLPVTDDHTLRSFVVSDAEAAARERAGSGLHLGLWEGDARLVGGVPCWWIDGARGEAEIGYWLVPDARERGLALRAARCVTDVLFDRFGVRRVELQCRVENGPSRRVAERLGATLEEVRTGSHVVDGVPRDHAVYVLLTTVGGGSACDG